MGESNRDYIRKHVDTIILRTLLESDSYGYDIMKEIESKSKGLYSVKQPTLYNSLKRLEKIGYINSYEGDISNGGKRRYYSLTDLGKEVLYKETSEWEFSRTLMSRLLSDKDYDLNSPPPYDANELRPMTKRSNAPNKPSGANYVYNSSALEQDEELEPEETIENIPKSQEIPYITTDYVEEAETKDVESLKKTKGYQLLYGYESEIEDIRRDSAYEDAEKVPENDIANKSVEIVISDISTGNLTEEILEKVDDIPIKEHSGANESVLADILHDEIINNSSNTPLISQEIKNTIHQEFVEPKTNPPVMNSTAQLYKQISFDEISKPTITPSTPPSKLMDIFSNKFTKDSMTSKEINQEVELEDNRIKDYDIQEKTDIMYSELNNKVQYRPALDELFKTNTKKRSPSPTKNYEPPVASYSFDSLKNKLKTEGYKLRPYSKTNTTSYYLSSFIYNSQINRDCFTMMYLLIVIELFAVYFLLENYINLGLNTYLTIATGLIFIPIVFWIVYAVNPNKRIKAKFNFKASILTSLMIFFNLLVVITLVGFFAFRADITDISSMMTPIIIPSIMILNIPLASVVYSLLYNTKKYHLK